MPFYGSFKVVFKKYYYRCKNQYNVYKSRAKDKIV